MKHLLGPFAVVLACTQLSLHRPAAAQVSDETLQSISTPNKVETGLGTLEFKDGAPTAKTVQKVYVSCFALGEGMAKRINPVMNSRAHGPCKRSCRSMCPRPRLA